MNRVRELIDFAQLEPDAQSDLNEQVRACSPDERRQVDRIAANLRRAVEVVENEIADRTKE